MSGHRKFRLYHNGTQIAVRDQVNLIDGSGVTLTVSDNPGSDRVDVTIAAAGGGGGGIGALVALTADASAISANTTPGNIGLSFNIGSSSTEMWFWEAFLRFTAANTTMDCKVGIAVPTAATASWGMGYIAGATMPGFEAMITSGTLTAVLTAAGTQAVASASGEFFVGMSGWIFGGGTAGAVNIQAAQNTSDPGNLVPKKGSWIRYTQVAS